MLYRSKLELLAFRDAGIRGASQPCSAQKTHLPLYASSYGRCISLNSPNPKLIPRAGEGQEPESGIVQAERREAKPVGCNLPAAFRHFLTGESAMPPRLSSICLTVSQGAIVNPAAAGPLSA